MNTLERICASKREHIAKRKSEISEERLRQKAQQGSLVRGFRRTLEEAALKNGIALIAEIKKASPSKGIIRSDFHPITLARAYKEGGATCLSVLTDEPFFQGRDDYLQAVHNAVKLPILRKDFMLDPYQIIESRVLGADCILLIMAALNDQQAALLNQTARDLKMDVLVEVHNEQELERALLLSPEIIGINNRDLKTLKVNLATAETLIKKLPKNILAVCESGINTAEDISRMRAVGFSCFLVGESLMRESDVKAATQRLLEIKS